MGIICYKGETLKTTCGMCKEPLEIVSHATREDLNFCPHCGANLLIEQPRFEKADVETAIQTLEMRMKDWRESKGPADFRWFDLRQAAHDLYQAALCELHHAKVR